MRKLNFILTIMILLSSSCEKEETDFPVYFYAPTIHGYYVTDDFGNMVELIGVDDMKYHDQRLDTVPFSNYILLNTFPNPCISYVNIYIGGQNIIKKIWIVPARASEGLPYCMNANCLIVRGQPIYAVETDAAYFTIDLSSYEYNYYRIYVKIDDILLWNNIVKQ
ncbi:MAG: hypothetical protein RBT02_10380 [Bacteroidales bacterium]|nr:hypothetical protein [Bacteroidales bacterium]